LDKEIKIIIIVIVEITIPVIAPPIVLFGEIYGDIFFLPNNEPPT
jgi:hypothetical protein